MASCLDSVPIGASFSFVGELEYPIPRASSNEDSRASSRLSEESSFSESDRLTARALARGEGVFMGEDFCGEIDRARSEAIEEIFVS